MKKAAVFLIFIGVVFALMFSYTAQLERESAQRMAGVIKENEVTMLNFGAELCPPCEEMQPVLEEVYMEYEDRVHFPYVDIREHIDLARQLGVRTTPTQIFFDHTGNERYRNEGFMEKQAIRDILENLLSAGS